MDITADANAIVEQAPNWNLAKDHSILELMKRISQNLEERAERTKNTIKEFEFNVKHTEIALDNMANSLRSLCNQQFVEEIIEELEDNDFDMFGLNKEDNQPESPTKSSKEMMVEFVQNNLKMFRENFEAITINVPDSDDEDEVTERTIYRAKNPYDAIPLPYIIGSKEWNEHKYAGLYDSSNDSEEPEEFSSSSSDENEALPTIQSLEKKPTNTLSDSSSLSSLHIEPASVRRTISDAMPSMPSGQSSTSTINIQPKTQTRQIISSALTPHDHDLFAKLRQSPPSDDPPSTSSSARVSPLTAKREAQHIPPIISSLSSSSSSASKPNLRGRQSPLKLFDEAVPVSASASTIIPRPKEVNTVSIEPIPPNQIKRKPVNLFNDDEFDSFMAEIADKVQAKAEKAEKAQPVSQPVLSKQNPEPKIDALAAEKVIDSPSQTLNLFDDSPPLSPHPAIQSKSTITPKKSIFDDNLDSEDFLSTITSKVTKQKAEQRPKLSLFDDDDDDLDIEDIFGKKSVPVNKATTNAFVKASMFDNDKEHEANKTVTPTRKDVLKEETLSRQKPIESVVVAHVEKPIQPLVKSKSLFDDIDDDDLFSFVTPKQKIADIPSGDDAASTSTQHLPEEAVTVLPKESASTSTVVTESVQIEPTQVLIQSTAIQKDESAVDFDSVAVTIRDTEPTIETISQTNNQKAANNINTLGQVEPLVIPTFEEEDVFEICKESNKQQSEQSNEAEQENDGSDVFRDDLFAEASAATSAANTPIIPTKKEDPIISMVADITACKSSSNTPQKVADMAAAQQIMQNYTNLFSDEPPDDSEFFQNLSSSGLSSLSASKIFDAEQDFFEPSLPDIPSATKATASTATDQQGSSDYSGVQLFSDVPPEDDDQPDNSMSKVSAAPEAAAATRIHTIFYDDFSETARATTAEAVKPTNLPIEVSFFDDEPPPDLRPSTLKQADAVNCDVPKIKEQLLPPIKKLKMPNININVKALLPGSGVMPKLKKSEDSIWDENDGNTASTVPSANVRVMEPTPNTVNENILPSVNKSRARGPAQRRPSTRRGRHENYEKALLVEAEAKLAELAKQQQSVAMPSKPQTAPASKVSFLDSDNENEFLAPVQSLPEPKPTVVGQSPLQTKPTVGNVKTTGTIPKVTKNTTAKLFEDSDDDADDLFSGITVPKSKPSAPATLKASGVAANIPAAAKSASLFSSDEDDSLGTGDFLRALKQPTPKPKTTPSVNKSLFSDDEDNDDDLFSSGSHTKQHKQPPSAAPSTRQRHQIVSTKSLSTTKTVTPSENPLADLLDS